MQVTDRRVETEIPGIEPPRRSRIGIVVLVVVLVAASIGGAVWILNDEERTAIDVVQDLATAMREDNTALLQEVFGVSNSFIEWQIALELYPEFTDCSELPLSTGGTRVGCAVTYDINGFYPKVLGRGMTTTISGVVGDDGYLTGTSFPPPAGLLGIESELRTWVQEVHPELEDQLYGSPGFFGIKMTRESGELRMQLLDEFMASRQG
ncbi:MAG: hypothetical protein HKN01_07615 [Acidimicrobiia bacterium]|nr:hypothetical protein [Acidimicrobiia bacterium]